MSQDANHVVIQSGNAMDGPEETQSVHSDGSMIVSADGGSITYPYETMLKDTSFPRFYPMARPGNQAETYNGSLCMLGHGTPLWEPVGDLNRPKKQLNSGISIGDVGFLDTRGSFECYFNIFLPPNDPAQLHCPPDFMPLDPPDESELSSNAMHFPPGTILVSSGIKTTTLSPSPLDIKFTVNAREGAILILPDGASREDLFSTTRVQEYVQKHVLEWYKFVKRLLGDIAVYPNGTLYVVTGTDKATTWATCVTYPQQTRLDRLWKPSEIDYRGAKDGSPHRWKSNRKTDEELVYKRSRVYEDVGKCAVFIRGMRVAVNIRDWTEHVLRYKTPGVTAFSIIRTVPIFGLRAKIQTLEECRPGYSQMIPAEDGNAIRIMFHPLDIILRVLIEEYPSVTMAYIDDRIWCSVADKSDANLASFVRLVVQILETHEASVEEGRITLLPRKTGSQEKTSPQFFNPILHFSTYIKQKHRAWIQHRRNLRRVAKVFPGPKVPVHLLISEDE